MDMKWKRQVKGLAVLISTLVEMNDKEWAPFETTLPLLCLIMKRAIFSCSLAAASSA